MKKTFLIQRVMLAVWFLIIGACAQSQYLDADAAKFCELYKPETWSVLGKNASLYEIYGYIISQQNKHLKDSKLLAIINTINVNTFQVYAIEVRSKINSLIGKDWECDDFDDFYAPKQSVVNVALLGIETKRINPEADDVLLLLLSDSGSVLIGGAPLISSDVENIKKGIISFLGSRKINDTQFVIYADEGSNGNLMSRILKALVQLNVKNVQIIDF